MKRFSIYIILYILAGCLTSCRDKKEEEPGGEEPSVYESVAIMYMIADNSLNDFAEYDIQELVNGKDNIPTDSKVIIYVDKLRSTPVIYQVDARHGKRVWKQYANEEDCTDSLNMLNTLSDIVRSFPAKKYGLSFCAHGSGWQFYKRRSIGPDQSHGSKEMNVPTIRGVLEHLPHMQYVFFDVCFMQCIEAAYELRNVTDWVVGSPAEIPMPGAPYHLIARAMAECDAMGIVNGYDSYYPITYNYHYYPGVLLAAVDCAELEQLADATRPYVQRLFAGQGMLATTEPLQKYSTFFIDFTYCYDMNTIMYNNMTGEEYAEWLEAFDRAVPLRTMNSGTWAAGYCYPAVVKDKEHYGGISMYIPEDKEQSRSKMEDMHQLEWYRAAGWDTTGW